MKKTVTLLAIFAMAFMTVPASSQACCFYNHATTAIRIYGNAVTAWDVSPSGKRCTDGIGGRYTIYVLDSFRKHYISREKDDEYIEVDKHGWLSVYPEENRKWRVTSKNKKGHIVNTYYLHRK